MKSLAAILTLAVLTWFGLTVTLRGQSQGTRQRFDESITLRDLGPQPAPAAVLHDDAGLLDLTLRPCL